MIALFITGSVIGAVLMLFAGIYLLIGPDQVVDERLDDSQIYVGAATGRRSGLSDRVSSRLNQGQFGSKLAKELNQAGVSLTPAEFTAMNAGMIVLSLLLGFLLTQTFIAGVGLAILAGMGPRIWLKRIRGKRMHTFQKQLPDVLSLIVGSLRAGYGLIQAMKLVAQEMPSPSAEEYGRVVDEVSLGFTLEQALHHLVERMESDDLMMVTTAINIQNEVGGNLGAILETIAETIRDRVKLVGEIKAMTSMQRATGYLLAALPFFVAAILMFLNPEYILEMFVFPWIAIPIGAVTSMTFGIIVMNKLIQIDF